jgi:hypothetical protein
MPQSANVVLLKCPIGPGENTPERREWVRRASVTDIRDRLAEHSRISAKTWIYIGNSLAHTKASAEKDGAGVFASLFAKNTAERNDAERFPFSLSTGYMLMAIDGRFSTMVEKQALPSAWRTLYELTRIPHKRLNDLIESGAVHPMMTRVEAVKLTGKRANSATAEQSPARIYAVVKRTFKPLPPIQRIEFLRRLMDEYGISYEQLKGVNV